MGSGVSEILKKIRKVRVAVYGDFCLDDYLIMHPEGSEISVETGQQAEAVRKHYQSLGGAGNVVANLAALQPRAVKAIGVIGNDMHGRELSRQLHLLRIDTASLFVQHDQFDTYTFTKRYLGEEEISRTDFGVHNIRSQRIEKQILESLEFVLQHFDVLIFNQQIPGSIQNPAFINAVNDLFYTFSDRKILLDSRHLHHKFKNVSLKLNQIEVARLNGATIGYQDYIPIPEVVEHGKHVFDLMQKPVYITCGEEGMVVIEQNRVREIPGIEITSKIDSVGAGDTALSALALCLGAGCSSVQAANLANLASAVSVQKLFTTGTASAEEIQELSRKTQTNYKPGAVLPVDQARYLEKTRIELCYKADEFQFGEIKHAVFDHDGTISTLRQGWEEIMESVMVASILGPHNKTIHTDRLKKVQETCIKYIDDSTGVQTIIQMQKLVDLVEMFGFVPKHQILDAKGYKKIFKTALLQVVNQRITNIQKGQMSRKDYLLKGAVEFLNTLRKKKMKLYLVSGTDAEDVINEAQLLGYAHLFERIYGSLDDLTKFSKKKVMGEICEANHLRNGELLVFGDGPIEMQECRRSEGIAVGVASDEVNPGRINQSKRVRLIKSGAQIIIPDYAQGRELINLLFKGS